MIGCKASAFDKLRWKLSGLRRWLLEDMVSQGLGGPPNNWRSTGYIVEEETKKDNYSYKREMFAKFGDDAFTIWIGVRSTENGRHEERLEFSTSTRVFRAIALWYLWRWAWGEWFGLRRWLYYRDLHRRCERLRAVAAEIRETGGDVYDK